VRQEQQRQAREGLRQEEAELSKRDAHLEPSTNRAIALCIANGLLRFTGAMADQRKHDSELQAGVQAPVPLSSVGSCKGSSEAVSVICTTRQDENGQETSKHRCENNKMERTFGVFFQLRLATMRRAMARACSSLMTETTTRRGEPRRRAELGRSQSNNGVRTFLRNGP
jgi:hypothetical protein